jgi:hypothetical protein
MKIGEDAMEERPPGIELDRSNRPLCQPAEIAGEVEEQIDAGGQQQQAARDSLQGDQPKDTSAARAVCRSGHGAHHYHQRVHVTVKSTTTP